MRSAGVPPEVKEKAERYLSEISSKTTASKLSGEAFLGWRYQSNANLGPATSQVLLFGQAANLNQAGLGTPDWGVVSSFQLRHVYDFGHQDRSALETTFTAYASRQFQQVDDYVRQRLVLFLSKKMGRRGRHWGRYSEAVYRALGVYQLSGTVGWYRATPTAAR